MACGGATPQAEEPVTPAAERPVASAAEEPAEERVTQVTPPAEQEEPEAPVEAATTPPAETNPEEGTPGEDGFDVNIIENNTAVPLYGRAASPAPKG